ncbi:MAG: choice-of-anchor Q domain-containing protein [Verrucomicrobiota bacterium]
MKTRLFELVVAATLLSHTALAATLTVTSPADSGPGSLRNTVAIASNGDTITFDSSLNGQTITLTTGEILLNKTLTITGPGSAQLAISGNDTDRIFRATAAIILSGLTLRNGFSDEGAALVLNNASGNVSDCVFSNNATPDGIGGAVSNPSSPMQFTNCTFTNNSASGFGVGGAFFGSEPEPVTMTDCTFSGNSAHDGGAIFTDAPLTLVRCKFNGNSIPSDGIAGAIYNDFPTDITASTFSGNTTGNGGAGGALFVEGDVTIRDSTVSGNSVGASTTFASQGGGIWSDGTVTINNSTIANNTGGTGSQGGGIYTENSAISLNDSTVSGNSAAEGGGIYNNGSTVNSGDTIVARNTAPSGPDFFGAIASQGYNLIGDTADSTGETGTDLVNMDPQLGPLQNNGGLTLTMALLPTSPAIDMGNPAFDPNAFTPPMNTDQRGSARVVNGRIDIGSYEFSSTNHPPQITSLTGAQTRECTSSNGTSASITVSATDADGDPLTVNWSINNQIVRTDTIPAGGPPTSGSVTLTRTYPLGTTTVTVSVSDGKATVMQSTTVTIVDTTPPVITSISANPSVITAPNKKLVPVTVSVTATDICDPHPMSKIVSVTSNEPGAGQYQITGDLTLKVLADRDPHGTGRIYTITVRCTDMSGNFSSRTVTVTVRH